MLNSSAYAVFERMWQHVLARFNNYALSEDLDGHVQNTNNPHSVTKADVGLGSVDNTSDAQKPISDATKEALDKKADSEDFDNHIESATNPHGVTAEQVGAIPVTGGSMESTLTLKGIVLTEGIDYGSGDPSGGTLGQLYFKKVT